MPTGGTRSRPHGHLRSPPDGSSRGEPVAGRPARRVRRAARGNGPVATPGPRPGPTQRSDRLGDSGADGYPADYPGGAVAVQPMAIRAAENRPVHALADGQVNRPRGAWCQWDGDDLAPRLRRSAPSAWTWNRSGQAISTAWPTSR